ncbi:hypothetical protein HGRIS_006162 [Hohenbuehelia grisea]|uniref:Nucleolar protein 12 n=1 Tax=Hohenbuehelia grisea TaxID=104357 RepID=A0ABR3K172_9AGAR
MSLSTFLLGSSTSKKKSTNLDSELDALFKSNPAVSSTSVVASTSASASASRGSKQKRTQPHDDADSSAVTGHPAKRLKHDQAKVGSSEDGPAAPSSEPKISSSRSKADRTSKKKPEVTKDSAPKEKADASKKGKDKKGKAPVAPSADAADSEDENADLEDAYLSRIPKKGATKRSSSEPVGGDDSDEEMADAQSGEDDEAPGSEDRDDNVVPSNEDEDEDEGDEADATPLVHESVSQPNKRSGAPKTKYVPPDETPAQRDARTIFVGNLPIAVAQKKLHLKQLQRHILAHVPNAKIESTRFRSVPFEAPTAQLPNDADSSSAQTNSKTSGDQAKPNPRTHDRERTSAWRSTQANDPNADESGKSDAKRYMTASQKKRVAFITNAFHASADVVHAYIVFAHPPSPEASSSRAPNVPPPAPCMDPYAAATEAARAADGTMFMERAIRVDVVRRDAATSSEAKGDAGSDVGNPKLSVFVGNLDFASKEEDLRVFFEGVVAAERGPPPEESEGEGEARTLKIRSWVTRVRIVRDRETQLGKGFAYVQFDDRECVDQILALEAGTLKFAKRKLRVQRCKTLPGAPPIKSQPARPSRQASALTSSTGPKGRAALSSKPLSAPVSVPAGDPSLGDRLAHLPKEDRKQAKAADADRVARRLAKKKARMAMANKGHDKLENGKPRERSRQKKSKVSGEVEKKEKKRSRVRSEKSLEKRNAKK